MIHSISIFLDEESEMSLKSNTEKVDNRWPLYIGIISKKRTTLQIHMGQKEFIKLKNEILSLDRQYEERRKSGKKT